MEKIKETIKKHKIIIVDISLFIFIVFVIFSISKIKFKILNYLSNSKFKKILILNIIIPILDFISRYSLIIIILLGILFGLRYFLKVSTIEGKKQTTDQVDKIVCAGNCLSLNGYRKEKKQANKIIDECIISCPKFLTSTENTTCKSCNKFWNVLKENDCKKISKMINEVKKSKV
jgi:hypothetical protein